MESTAILDDKGAKRVSSHEKIINNKLILKFKRRSSFFIDPPESSEGHGIKNDEYIKRLEKEQHQWGEHLMKIKSNYKE
jgi:hypothetical protein